MEEDEHRKICFPMRNKENLLENQYVDHHIEILSHDRDYRNVDAPEQFMLSIKTECRPRLNADQDWRETYWKARREKKKRKEKKRKETGDELIL